ncbi:MAG: ComF family protein [Glaciecola sp.]|jgi:ComF family protein
MSLQLRLGILGRLSQARLDMLNCAGSFVPQLSSKLNAIITHQNCYLCHQYSQEIICCYCVKSLVERDFGQVHSGFSDLLRNPMVLKNLDEPEYDHLYAIDNYIWPIDKLVLDMKFASKSVAAKALSRLFLQFVFKPCINEHLEASSKNIPQLLTPVPLSRKRYWQRQYNQAQLLCDCLSTATNIPNQALVKRVKHTLAQTELDKQQRIENVMNAFECSAQLPFEHIAIVDDVITTGVTINAVCRAVKQHKPNIKISVWTMAVTLLD